MAKPIHLSRDELRQLLRYEPETGKLFWRHRGPEWFRPDDNRANQWNSRCADKEAGYVHPRGYIHVRLPRSAIQLKAHRIIFYMVHGLEPDTIDHIDGDPANNRIENLRAVTQAENAKNCRMWSHNKSGRTGVCWNKYWKKWNAYIIVGKRQISLGSSQSFEECVARREAAERKYGFHENHGRVGKP